MARKISSISNLISLFMLQTYLAFYVINELRMADSQKPWYRHDTVYFTFKLFTVPKKQGKL